MSFLKAAGKRIVANGRNIFINGGAPVGDHIDPSVPQNLAALVVGLQVNLTWDASTDNVAVLGYRIYRDGVEVGTTLISNVKVDNVPDFDTYDYTVAAVDTSGNESAQSAVLTVVVQEGVTDDPPSIPTNVDANVNPTTNLVTLTWTASTDDVGVFLFVVYRNGNPIAFSQGSPYTETLTASGTYTYQVEAVDTVGQHSGLSVGNSVVVVIAEPEDEEAPSVPTGVTATWDGSRVTVRWNPSTDNVGVALYVLYRNGSVLTFGNALTYKDAPPASGTYTYRVAAQDAAKNTSAQSAAASITVTLGGSGYSPEAWAAAQVPPVSFPSDDSSDVSVKMAAFFATVPKAGPAVVNFKANGVYHMEEMLTLLKYNNLTINFNGATFSKHNWNGGTALSQKYPYRNNGNLRLHNCNHIVLNGPRMTGAMVQWNNGGDPVHVNSDPTRSLNPDQTKWDAYQIELEAQHGIWISGGNDITLTGGKITDVFGDFIALERGNGDTVPNDVVVDGIVGRRAGRQGIGGTAMTNFILRNSDCDDNRRSWVDLEPYSTKDYIRGVTIRNNLAGLHILNWVSSGGQGAGPDNVLIENNRDVGGKCNVFCQSSNPNPGRRKNWTVTNNRSDTKAAGKSVHTFTNVDGLTVGGSGDENTQPVSAGMYYSLVRDCTDATVGPNTVTGVSGVTGDGMARYEHRGSDGLYTPVGYSPSYTV